MNEPGRLNMTRWNYFCLGSNAITIILSKSIISIKHMQWFKYEKLFQILGNYS